MTATKTPATLLCDFYKLSHGKMYPEGTEYVYSTFTPRSNKFLPHHDDVVVFGIQGFCKKYLIEYFNENFFNRSKQDVISEYERLVKFTLGGEVDSTHIAELHDLGYLPIKISTLPEGTLAPIKTPVITVENTHPKFFWITNYLETLLSTELWQMMTSATKARKFRQTLEFYAKSTAENDDYIKFTGHDFSMRGMSSLESAQLSGAGHLLSFVGTDTIPAITYLEQYYNANVENELVGTSIPASEHSVMCAYGQENELESIRHLITNVYPDGLVSIVMDSWDFFKVITEYLPQLKNDILTREGRTVVRPDSGCPIKVLCGNPGGETEAERKGLIVLLDEIFGSTTNSKGYKELNSHIGVIYGDSIDEAKADKIMQLMAQKGYASNNVVYGIGSFFYQMNTRDSLGFAMKATHAVINGEEKMLFKDPKTDDGTKRSQRGRVVVRSLELEDGCVAVFGQDGLTIEEQNKLSHHNLLQPVFENGKLLYVTSLSEIRQRLHGETF